MPLATISTVNTGTTAVSSTTSVAATIPASSIGGQYTMLCVGRSLDTLTDPTVPTNWAEVYTGWCQRGSGATGRAAQIYHRSTTGNLIRGEAALDAAGVTVTAGTLAATSDVGAVAVTVKNGKPIAATRCFSLSNVAIGATEAIGPGASTGNAWTQALAVGDKVYAVVVSDYSTAPTITASTNCGAMTLVQSVSGAGPAEDICVYVFEGTVSNTNQSTFTFSVKNNSGVESTVFALTAVAVRPFNTTLDGAGGAPIKVMAIGDSITAGSNFSGQVLGKTVGDPAQRWLDRLFGVKSTSLGVNIDFQADTVVNNAGNRIAWYAGTYVPTGRSVRVRDMGQPGWDMSFHIENGSWKNNTIGNPTDSGYSPDILIISLGANDERNIAAGLDTPTYFKDGAYALACVYNNPTYVVLVKQWAWSFDWVSGAGSAFTGSRLGTHAQYHTAIDDAATLIAATGRTVIVVNTNVDAALANQVGTSTPGVNRAYSGLLNDGVTVSSTYSVPPGAVNGSASDNIHSNALGYAEVWAPTIRKALDAIPLLAAPSSGGGTPSLPTIPSLPTVP